MRKLFLNGSGNGDGSKQRKKYFYRFDQNKVVKRRGIGNNQRNLQTEPPQRRAITLQIFEGVFKLYRSRFQKRVNFGARFQPEQTTQLKVGNLALAVSL